MKTMKNYIKLFSDGPNLSEIGKDFNVKIDGYTFNPSLFKKNGATDYLDYSKKILEICSEKPVSLEVFADDENGMIEQGRILNKLSKNVYVKIPITYTDGKSTSKVIQKLLDENIKLNITAIFVFEQIKDIIKVVQDSKSILSIFAGRIYDCGIDAKEEVKIMNQYIRENSKCESLWASTRMAFDYITAAEVKTDIITMQTSHIEKLKMIGFDPKEYSLKTVKQFYEDAKTSGFKI
jgi:transaldolase